MSSRRDSGKILKSPESYLKWRPDGTQSVDKAGIWGFRDEETPVIPALYRHSCTLSSFLRRQETSLIMGATASARTGFQPPLE